MKLSELIIYSLVTTFLGAFLFGAAWHWHPLRAETDDYSSSRVSVSSESVSYAAFHAVVDGDDMYALDSKFMCTADDEIISRDTGYYYYGADGSVDSCNGNLIAIIKNEDALIKVLK